MPEPKLEDVAYLTRSRSPAAGSGGMIRCVICPWTVTTPDADIDAVVEAHLGEIHPNHVNAGGLHKIPRVDLKETFDNDFGDADVIYFIIVPD
jgi:hypothetical protein